MGVLSHLGCSPRRVRQEPPLGNGVVMPFQRSVMKKTAAFLLALLAFLVPCLAHAEVSLTLVLDRNAAALMDTVRLTVRLSGIEGRDSEPVIHGVEGFDVSR